MVIAGAAQIGVIEQRRLPLSLEVDLSCLWARREATLLQVSPPILKRRGSTPLRPDPHRRREYSFKMPRQVRKPVRDAGRLARTAVIRPFGARSDLGGPAAEPIRRPLGVAPM